MSDWCRSPPFSPARSLGGAFGHRGILDDVSIFSVAISLSSETLSVEELTALAGVSPSRSHVKGDRRTPRSRVHPSNYWSKDSGVELDSWTLAPHWPAIAPVLESLASTDRTGVEAHLAIGTSARGMGFAFDLEPHQVELLSRAGCGVWIDSYDADPDENDRPDDYPYPVGGTLRPPGRLRRLRRRVNLTLRHMNLFGKVHRHRRKVVSGSTA